MSAPRRLSGALVASVAVTAALAAPGAWAADPDEPTEPPAISCRVEPQRSSIDVVCSTESLEAGTSLRVQVAPTENAGASEDVFLQGAGPVVDGQARAVVELPCGYGSGVEVEASARAEGGTRIVHRETLSPQAASCLGRWDLTPGQWTRLVALLSVPVLAVVGWILVVRRRRARRRRSRRRRSGRRSA